MVKPSELCGRLKGIMEEKGLDALLISKIENVRYLTGFTGTSGFVLVREDNALFITDPRYTQQAKRECEGWEVFELKGKRLSQWMAETIAPKRLGVEQWLTLGSLERMKEHLKDTVFVVVFDVVENMRVSKTEDELKMIKEALRIAEESFKELLSLVKPGVSERDLALELEWLMRKKGAEAVSFSIIVASGARSALPHGVASGKVIEPEELVLFDFGCVHRGYCSDITRVVKLGRVSREEKRVWQAVVDASRAAVEAIENGERSCSRVHKTAEEVLSKYGYNEYFGHGLGHGVGLEIHEKPSLSLLSEDSLVDGCVFTVEPGVYLPGRFGIRIEDMFYLKGDLVRLTSLHSEIIEL